MPKATDKKKPSRLKEKQPRPLVSELSEEGRLAHYSAILIEDLKSQFKLVVEHVEGIRETLSQEMGHIKQKLGSLEHRMDKLEYKVDKGFADNERRWQENERRWRENDAWQHEAIKTLGRIESKLDTHEERITCLEGDVALLRDAR